MRETPFIVTSRLFIKLSRWFWKRSPFIWSGLLAVLLAVLVNILLASTVNISYTPIDWIIQHGFIAFILLMILCLLLLATYLVSRLAASEVVSLVTDKELVQYLLWVIAENEQLTVSGVPTALVSQCVPLDDVFIPLRFQLSRSLIDYPLTQRDLKEYRKQLHDPVSTTTLESFLFENERNWSSAIAENNRIDFDGLWRRLTPEQPAIVIQGYPGSGKSTLFAWLALSMARRSLNQVVPQTPTYQPDPPLIPAFLRLRDYANALASTPTLSLLEYLSLPSTYPGLSADVHLAPLFQKQLDLGKCLLLLDGLDEVSDPSIRKQVQEAIHAFSFVLRANRKKTDSFNRLLLNSRIAGYDPGAFPEYPYYRIAELDSTQIEHFLLCWYQTTSRLNRSLISASLSKEKDVRQDAQTLLDILRRHPDVLGLAENPCLLTLLAVMQQGGIELPRQRVELYRSVVVTLLEHRNSAKNLPSIPETLAIQRLGPLAYHMQETGNALVRYDEVIASLKENIGMEGGTTEEITQEAQSFLIRIRERGGIFVERMDSYFGFVHRTFQEYFAARYMLQKIRYDPKEYIAALVDKARRRDDLWREPFLIAVAYESGNGEMASKIIQRLLEVSVEATAVSREHDLLLAAECVIEAGSWNIDPKLEQQIVHALLRTYKEALHRKQFEVCESIEAIMCRWLVNLPVEAYRPPLLTELSKAINTSDPIWLNSTLILLTLIAGQLISPHSIVFNTLVSSLLRLSSLPPLEKYHYSATVDLSASQDLSATDLAVSVLASLGWKGPSGVFLKELRGYFDEEPEAFRLLAYYSLECNVLLLPVMVPLSEENSQHYKTAVSEWITLRDKQKTSHRITEKDIDTCCLIQSKLLSCAEEVYYPRSLYILNMLKYSATHSEQSWKSIWQTDLMGLMTSGRYLDYQEAALLWTALFPEPDDLYKLAILLQEDYRRAIDFTSYPLNRKKERSVRYAQRFLAFLSNDLHSLINVRDGFSLRNIRDISYLRDHRALQEMQDMYTLRTIQSAKDIRNLQCKPGPRYLRGQRNLQGLRDFLLTEEVAKLAIKQLPTSDMEKDIDLLTIVLGRVLQIAETNVPGSVADEEIQQIAQYVYVHANSVKNEEVRNAMLKILCYLPARTTHEIMFILKLAEEASDETIQDTCAAALRRTQPETSDAWDTLTRGLDSNVETIRFAVNLRKRK